MDKKTHNSPNLILLSEIYKFFIKSTRTDYRGLLPEENIHIYKTLLQLEKNILGLEKNIEKPKKK